MAIAIKAIPTLDGEVAVAFREQMERNEAAYFGFTETQSRCGTVCYRHERNVKKIGNPLGVSRVFDFLSRFTLCKERTGSFEFLFQEWLSFFIFNRTRRRFVYEGS